MGKEIIVVPDCPMSPFPQSTAIRTDELLWVSGQMATDYRSGLAPEADIEPGLPNYGASAMKRQTRYIYQNLTKILKAGGSSLEDLIRVDQYVADHAQFPYYIEARNEFLLRDRPTSSALVVNNLEVPEAVIVADFISVVSGGEGYRKESFGCNKIPQPLAGYSVAQQVGDLVFLPGNLASDYKTGLAPEARVDHIFWYDLDIKKQTEFILKTRRIVLEELGLGLEDVVMALVYMMDVRDFPGFEEIWVEHFPKEPPARTVIPVDRLGFTGHIIEISVIAVRQGRRFRKETVETSRAPHPLTHEPQAVKVGPYLFLSGQMAIDEKGLAREAQVNPRLQYHESSVKKQTSYIMKNVQAICEAAGGSLDCIVKRQAFHSDLREMYPAFEVWREAFPQNAPVSTTVSPDSPLPVPGCSLLLSLIGYVS